MTLKLPNWRLEEPSFEEVAEQYPDVSPFVILKTDISRRGYALTERARSVLNNGNYITVRQEDALNPGTFADSPRGIIFRDATSITVGPDVNIGIRDPYVIDEIDGQLYITDNGEIIEAVDFWRKPDFYDKVTSKGTPMSGIIGARPHRLDIINPNKYCHFWGQGEGCKFCFVGPEARLFRKNPESALSNPEDIEEAVTEALKQKGRYTMISTTAGSILSGNELFDDEVQMYIDIFSRIRRHLKGEKINFQIISSAFSEKQLERLKDSVGQITYTSNLEVPTKELFEWICPGKARYVGFEEWKQRLYNAVEIFGRGNVNSQLVAGADLVQPNGFKTEDESIRAILELTEELAEHGVGVVANVWFVVPTIIFKNFYPPALEYYVRIFKGINDILNAHKLDMYFDDYKQCGSHPSSDLLRI